MIIKTWLISKDVIFFVAIFLTFSFSLLRGQQLSYQIIQSDTLIAQPDSGLSIDKEDSLYSISDKDIQKEMRFSTRNKIGSCIGGGFFGFFIGGTILTNIIILKEKPAEVEGLGLIPLVIACGSVGAILGGKLMYEIVEHSEKKASKNRLLKKQKNEKQTKDKESD